MWPWRCLRQCHDRPAQRLRRQWRPKACGLTDHCARRSSPRTRCAWSRCGEAWGLCSPSRKRETVFLLAVAFLPWTFPILWYCSASPSSPRSRIRASPVWSISGASPKAFSPARFRAGIRRRCAWPAPSAPVCLTFLVGALLGSVATTRLHNLALLISCATLKTALALCRRADRGGRQKPARVDAGPVSAQYSRQMAYPWPAD